MLSGESCLPLLAIPVAYLSSNGQYTQYKITYTLIMCVNNRGNFCKNLFHKEREVEYINFCLTYDQIAMHMHKNWVPMY